jgi:hypothetical protein
MNTPKFPSRFEQVEEIASTPLSRTYRAMDRLMKREVILSLPAVKAWSGWKGDARARLLREAQAIGKVQHEGIQPVLWVEEIEDGLLVVQPPPSGERLTDHVKQGPMSVEAVLRIGVEIGEALAAVHYAGIVHRCIGLDAVWIQASGKIRLGAFTYAKAFDDAMISTSLNHGVGKGVEKSQDAVHLPPYPAPELLAGRGADPRADVYALGCLMFRCLAGHDPLLSGDGMQMPDVRAARKDVPKALGEVIRRCMLVEKTARYPTAQAVVDALKAMQVAAVGGSGSASKWAGMAAAAVVAVGAVGFLMMPDREERGSESSTAVTSTVPPPSTLTGTYAKGHALLIGIGQAYERTKWQPLRTPANEIREVKAALMQADPVLWTEASIQTIVDEQASSDAINDAVERIKEQAQPEDCVFIYYAGHGAKLDKADAYWLVCNDAEGSLPRAGGSKGYLDCGVLADLQKREYCKAKHVLVMLDSCHAGQFLEARAPGSRGITPSRDKKAAVARQAEPCRHTAMEMIGSSTKDLASRDGMNGMTDFCREFLDCLRSPDPHGYRTASEIAERISKRLGSDQPPVFQSLRLDHAGRFVFFVQKTPN